MQGNVVLSDLDNAVGRVLVFAFPRVLVFTPSAFSAFPAAATVRSRLSTHDIRVRVHSGKLCRVGRRQRQQLSSNGLKVLRVVEE